MIVVIVGLIVAALVTGLIIAAWTLVPYSVRPDNIELSLLRLIASRYAPALPRLVAETARRHVWIGVDGTRTMPHVYIAIGIPDDAVCLALARDKQMIEDRAASMLWNPRVGRRRRINADFEIAFYSAAEFGVHSSEARFLGSPFATDSQKGRGRLPKAAGKLESLPPMIARRAEREAAQMQAPTRPLLPPTRDAQIPTRWMTADERGGLRPPARRNHR